MKLTSIKLCNFRSFYGTTPEIILAVGDILNTTIIHGNNGAGKTSLLNAFTWVLYEKFSAAFASTEQLVNKRSIAEAQTGQAIECWVEVGWEHEGKRYRVQRSCRGYKNPNDFTTGKTQLRMWVGGDDGKWYLPPQLPEDIINQILPASLHQLTEVKNRQEKQFRLQLEKRVQEIFTEISFAPYIPKISEKYELTLVEHTSGIEAPVAASTGENQILSLSFIASIIDKVREWSEKRKMMMLPDSSTFPIVMDSPFGSLDEISRRHIAGTIPKLANQLIVLVTKTQWRGEVATEMADRIGREYVLTYYSSKPDCEQDDIELEGERYPLVKQSPNEFEYTEIMEVELQV